MKFLHPDLGIGNVLHLCWTVLVHLDESSFGLHILPFHAELPERSYGADCRLYLPENSRSRFKNVYVRNLLPIYSNCSAAILFFTSMIFIILSCSYFQETLFDEFVPAHIIGWWGKAIMIRNQVLLWVLSIGFEMMEVRFFVLYEFHTVISTEVWHSLI